MKSVPMNQVKAYVDHLSKVWKHFNEDNYAECLNEIQRIQAEGPIPEKYVTDFLYLKATSTDMVGRTLEAFKILSLLYLRYPSHEMIAVSMRVTMRRLGERAAELVRDKSNAVELREIWDAYQTVGMPPWWLTCEVARLEAESGDPISAKMKVQALLDLSPNDADFLREGLAMASRIEDGPWLAELIVRITDLSKKYPWRLDLLSLLPGIDAEPTIETKVQRVQ